MVDVVVSNDEGIRVTAVHRDGIVAGLVYLVVLKSDMVPPNAADTRITSLEVESSDDEVGGILDLDVVLQVAVVRRLRASEYWGFSISIANHNRVRGGSIDGNGPPASLRVNATMQYQLISGLKSVGHVLKFLIAVSNRRRNLDSGRIQWGGKCH